MNRFRKIPVIHIYLSWLLILISQQSFVFGFGTQCSLIRYTPSEDTVEKSDIIESSISQDDEEHFIFSYEPDYRRKRRHYIPYLNSKSRASKGEERSAKEFKVAIFGDQGLGRRAEQVLEMVKGWGAQAVFHLGDFDYKDDPSAFMSQLRKGLGENVPIVAAVGNHDVLEWFTPDTGYRDMLEEQLKRAHWKKNCHGEYGINFACVIENMVIVTSGIGTLGQAHALFINQTFIAHKDIPWKICIWHKNQRAYQTGDKDDATGYQVYELCRLHGAIVFTAHEHSYERTHLMSNFETQEIASTSNQLQVSPGKSFAAVIGLGGESIRYWRDGLEQKPWWAATAALDNGVNYGALLCSFNAAKNSQKTSCEFRDIDGNVWDSFTVHLSGSRLESSTQVYQLQPMTQFYGLTAHEFSECIIRPTRYGDIPSISVNTDLKDCALRPSRLELSTTKAIFVSFRLSESQLNALRWNHTQVFLEFMTSKPVVKPIVSPSTTRFVARSSSEFHQPPLFVQQGGGGLSDQSSLSFSFGSEHVQSTQRCNLVETPYPFHLRIVAVDPESEGLSESRYGIPRRTLRRAKEVSWIGSWETNEVLNSPDISSLFKSKIGTEASDMTITLALQAVEPVSKSLQSDPSISCQLPKGAEVGLAFIGNHEILQDCTIPSLIISVPSEST